MKKAALFLTALFAVLILTHVAACRGRHHLQY